jgi:hypothetical protein
MATIAVAALNPGSPELVAAVSGLDAELLPLQELDARLRAGELTGVVVLSDDLDSDLAVLVAGMLGNGAPPAVEVHSERWDGFHHSLLSSACRGVISGFGAGGVAAAILLLRAEEG